MDDSGYFKVTKNGETFHDFTWDGRSRVFTCAVNGVHIDASGYDCVTFVIAGESSLVCGNHCVINTSNNTSVICGRRCTISAAQWGRFTTDEECTFHTSHNCEFETLSDCTFNVGENCKIIDKNPLHTFKYGNFSVIKSCGDYIIRDGDKEYVINRELLEEHETFQKYRKIL